MPLRLWLLPHGVLDAAGRPSPPQPRAGGQVSCIGLSVGPRRLLGGGGSPFSSGRAGVDRPLHPLGSRASSKGRMSVQSGLLADPVVAGTSEAVRGDQCIFL